MTARRAVVALAVGAIVGVAVVAGVIEPPGTVPATIRFDGLQLQVTYLNGSSPLFGSVEQNACNQTLLMPFGPPLTPACPVSLVDGNPYDLVFYWTGDPVGFSPGLWTNFTITAPFNFTMDPGYIGSIPTIYSTTLGAYVGGANMLFSGGEYIGSALVSNLPTNFPPASPGLWLHGTLSVQPTNETYWP